MLNFIRVVNTAKNGVRFTVAVVICIAGSVCTHAQTSWKGIASTSWSTATNWIAGVPTTTVDAFIGDANFTGPYQPTLTATSACKNLTVGGQVTATLSVVKTFTVNGNMTFNSGSTITQSGVTFGVINFNGTVSPVLNSTSTPTYATLNINNTGGVTASVRWNVTVAMNISSGATFNGGGSTHNIYGSFTNNGTVTSSGTLNFLPTTAQTISLAGTAFTSTGMVQFGGSGPLGITGGAIAVFNTVIVSNKAGVTPASNWTIGADFSIASNAIFNAGSYTYAVGGDIESSGTLNGGTSSFTMSASPGTIDGSPATTFYDFTITGDITANADFNISHNYVNNNLFTANPGTVVFTGTTTSTLSGTALTYPLAQFDVRKSNNASVVLTKNVTNVTEVNVYTGVLDEVSFTLTGDAGGGLLHVDDSATLRIGGTNTLPGFTSYALDTFSTVEYYGAAQTIFAAAPYGNLTISSAGNKTAAAALTMLGTFSLSNGTFIGGSFTHNIGGSWRMTSGSFTNTGTTIAFNGTGAQDIFSTGAFNNLTMNKAAGQTTLSSPITVNAALTFLSGKITTGSNVLILASASGAVTGASASTGWVDGALRKAIPGGLGISRTFEVGDTAYSPVSIVFTTVLTAGTITARSTYNDHPQIASSGFAPSSTVNRYWTMTNASVTFLLTTLTFNWQLSDVDNGANPANFTAGKYLTGSWSQPGSSSPTATSIQSSGLLAFEGDFIVGELQQAAVWTGFSSTSWGTAGNWSTLAVPTNTTRVTIPSNVSRFPVLSSGTGVASDLTIQAGASLAVNNATLRLLGTVANSGTFTTSNATIEFAGNVAQTIPANTFSGNTLYNLTVNNPVGVTLAGALDLTNTLAVQNGTFTTGGFLTLRSTASGTARVAAVTSTAATPISGTLRVERYIPGRRKYRLMAPSVTTSTAVALVAGQEGLSIWGNWQNGGNTSTANTGTLITGGSTADGFDQQTNYPSLYTYDAVNRQYTPFTSANGKRTRYIPLQTGTAYFMFVYGDRVSTIYTNTPNYTVLSATGTLATGDQVYTPSSPVPLSGVPGRYTLLGNPFASPVDWASLPKTNLENTYWGWDPNLNATGGYVTVSTTGTVTLIAPFSGTTGLNQYIQPGQGFFVRTSGASPALTIREQDKSAINNTNAFRVGNANGAGEIPLLAVNLFFGEAGSRTLADGALVAFDPAFLNGVGPEDAAKLSSGAEALSIVKGSELLSIDGRPLPQMTDTLLLQLSGLSKPQYWLQIFAQQLAGSTYQLVLADNYLQTTRPLSLQDTNYIPFTVNFFDPASLRPNRFRILLAPQQALPLRFLSCTARLRNDQVYVSWKVAAARDVQKFVVERSQDGVDFREQGEVIAQGGREEQAYEWKEAGTLSGTRYYRIRAVEKEARSYYSGVLPVSREAEAMSISVYPNPVGRTGIGLFLAGLKKASYKAVLYDEKGAQVRSWQLDHPGGSVYQVLPVQQVPAGTYRLQVGGRDFYWSEPIIIL
ncbi:MAG: hypothetical protein INR73_15405 [Williamsia sp.]|nr:hypothetical protein [Williamsia sp.]